MARASRLEGNQIYLRRARLEDVTEERYQWMNDPEVVQYLECRFLKNTKAKLKSYIKEMNQNPDCRFFSIVEKQSGDGVGNIKLVINPNHNRGEVSLIIGRKSVWGKGYGSEAIRLVVEYAFNDLNLHKLVAGADEPNIASIKAFQKAGFEIEATLKEHWLVEGEYVSQILMALFKN